MQLIKAFTLALCSLPAVMAANEPCSYWDGNKYGVSFLPLVLPD
jgi:hypothetical protein